MPEAAIIGGVLLAAGASRRMGRPKQLLPIAGKPMVRHAVDFVLAAGIAPLVVVVGAAAPEVETALAGSAACVVRNADWTEGLGASLRCGVRAALSRQPGLAGLLVCLADQPGVTSGHLRKLVAAFRTASAGIVASTAQGIAQPPAIFAAPWFPDLQNFAGDTGARALLVRHEAEIVRVPLADFHDLDTPADYEKFSSRRPPGNAG